MDISFNEKCFAYTSRTDENGSGNGIATLTIEKLVVELGKSGEATTRITKATAAIAFVHQYTTEAPGANTIWAGEGSSQGYNRFVPTSALLIPRSSHRPQWSTDLLCCYYEGDIVNTSYSVTF